MLADAAGDHEASLSDKVTVTVGVTLPFLVCVGTIVYCWMHGWMGWLYLSMTVIGWMLTITGITVGYHRLLTHKAFETSRWVRGFWITLGALAVQGSLLEWCSVHRKHN